jgi:hypothetical protein
MVFNTILYLYIIWTTKPCKYYAYTNQNELIFSFGATSSITIKKEKCVKTNKCNFNKMKPRLSC